MTLLSYLYLWFSAGQWWVFVFVGKADTLYLEKVSLLSGSISHAFLLLLWNPYSNKWGFRLHTSALFLHSLSAVSAPCVRQVCKMWTCGNKMNCKRWAFLCKPTTGKRLWEQFCFWRLSPPPWQGSFELLMLLGQLLMNGTSLMERWCEIKWRTYFPPSHRARSTDRVSRHRSTNNQTYSAWEIHLERAKSCEAKIRGSHKVNVLAGWPGRHDKQLDCSLCLLKTMKGWLLYIQSCARHLIWCAILICVVLPIYRGLFHDTVGDVLWTSSTFWNISLLEENMKAQQALCTILKTVGVESDMMKIQVYWLHSLVSAQKMKAK